MTTRSAKPANSQKPARDRAVEAALALAAEKGWKAVTLTAVSRRAGMPLADLRDIFEDRFDIIAAWGRMIDRKVLAGAGSGESGSAHDRLFDVLMERFDVLNEHRAAARAILTALRSDPKQALISLPHLGRSMSWMLEAAGIETGGTRGALRIAGLTAAYLNTLRSWADDDSADMAKTMAALDKNLGRAEQWASTFGLAGRYKGDK